MKPQRPTRVKVCANGDEIVVERGGCLPRSDLRSRYDARRGRPAAPIIDRIRACKTYQAALELIVAVEKETSPSLQTRRKWRRAAEALPTGRAE